MSQHVPFVQFPYDVSVLDPRIAPRITVVDCPAPWWEHALIAYGVLLGSIEATWIADAMAATGMPGTLIDLILWFPLLVCAGRHLGAAWRGAGRAWILLLGYMTFSILWSDSTLDGGAKGLSMSTAVAWIALLTARPDLLATVTRTCLVVCVVSFVSRLFGITIMQTGMFFPAMVALFGHIALRERGRGAQDLGVAIVDLAMYLLLVAMVALSTFRAATISTAVGIAWCGRKSRPALVAAAVLAIFVGAFLAVAPPREQHYHEEVDRTDIRGRFETMDEDRLSGREDIWENVLADMRNSPPWLLYGTGIGDVEAYVGRLNATVNLSPRDGRPSVSTHNLALEVMIATGAPGLLLLIALVLDNGRRMRGDARLAMGVGMVVGCMAGLPMYDRSGGGTMFIGLLVALLDDAPARAARLRLTTGG